MITSAIAIYAAFVGSLDVMQTNPLWRTALPRIAEATECEFGLLARVNVDQHVIVFLLGWLALPVEVLRVVRRYLDAGSAGKDGVLLCATAAKHQVFYAVDFV